MEILSLIFGRKSELISIQGLQGSDTVTVLNGKISVPEDPNLVDRLDEKFWNILQNAHLITTICRFSRV